LIEIHRTKISDLSKGMHFFNHEVSHKFITGHA